MATDRLRVRADLESRSVRLIKAKQLTRFELKQDARPATEQSAAERYLEPSLFSLLDHSPTVATSPAHSRGPLPLSHPYSKVMALGLVGTAA
jgi:hypothetical protein